MNDEQRQMLNERGYVLLPQVLNIAEVEALRERLEALWAEEGNEAEAENYIEKNTRRLANLANKGDVFRPVYRHLAVLELAHSVLWPGVRISMLNARDALPGAGALQQLHSDADHGGRPDEKGYLCFTAVWLLDDFNARNGGTRLVPSTHRDRRLPKEALADPLAPHPAEVVVEGRAGDVLAFNGHVWHAGGANRSDGPRRALLVHYIRADQPQRLIQKEALSPDVQARLEPLERELLGLDD
jgi:ectoine hydroxylase-related dioxygenase (phytanoyl-CoA dioxygenase family)